MSTNKNYLREETTELLFTLIREISRIHNHSLSNRYRGRIFLQEYMRSQGTVLIFMKSYISENAHKLEEKSLIEEAGKMNKKTFFDSSICYVLFADSESTIVEVLENFRQNVLPVVEVLNS